MNIAATVKRIAFVDSLFDMHTWEYMYPNETIVRIEELTLQDCVMSSSVFHNFQVFLQNLTTKHMNQSLKIVNLIGPENLTLKNFGEKIRAKINNVFKVKPKFDMTKKSSNIVVGNT